LLLHVEFLGLTKRHVNLVLDVLGGGEGGDISGIVTSTSFPYSGRSLEVLFGWPHLAPSTLTSIRSVRIMLVVFILGESCLIHGFGPLGILLSVLVGAGFYLGCKI
jgi:hypothetical protein